MVNYELLYRCVITVDILLCAAIIVCNLVLLLSILSCKRARGRTRNAMLVSVCLADLLVGAFTHPIYIHSYHTGTLFHSCEMHILMQLIGDYSQVSVCVCVCRARARVCLCVCMCVCVREREGVGER